ncbi:unnamed protein product [Ixodes pacificus]
MISPLQWIGGIVSFQSWDDFWLNEAIIEYVLYLVGKIEGVMLGQEEADFELGMQHTLSQDIAEKTHPLSANTKRYSNHSLDAFSTRKVGIYASEAIRNIRQLCLRSMLSANNLSSLQRLKIISQCTVSIRKTQSFPPKKAFRQITTKINFKTLTLSRMYWLAERTCSGNAKKPKLKILDATKTSPVKIKITSIMLFREENRSDINLCNFVTANLPSVPKDDDWLILNLRGYGYYRVNYDARNWNLILMELNTYHTNIDVLNRARIIDDLFDLADMSILPYGTALHASEYLRREKEIIPWLTLLKKWQYIEAMLSGGTIIEKWKLFIIRLLIHHVHSFKWSTVVEDNEKSVFRRLAAAGRPSRGSPLIRCLSLYLFNFGGRFSWRSARLCQYREGHGAGFQRVHNSSHAACNVISLSPSKSRALRNSRLYVQSLRSELLLITRRALRQLQICKRPSKRSCRARYCNLFPPYPEIFGDILVAVFSNINTMAELRKVINLFKQHGASLDAHKAALERIKESANRNVHWVMNHYAEVSRWLKRDVTEFILDDQVMRGNITNNATIGGGNVSDVFFEEMDFTNVTRN